MHIKPLYLVFVEAGKILLPMPGLCPAPCGSANNDIGRYETLHSTRLSSHRGDGTRAASENDLNADL